ncbi:unnamed protein product [Tilletia controversa]|uniref:Uncharacterized protein n=1 Tax=Tilletia controversa TaxID=13291 RepID=A0A8X7MVS2_9BASI|nr:hypothetical protein A4X06_0g2465 [Tilletia controversa]CAD6956506.1 unnamed protein product [Tilletia controversa]CAD6985649.1 unnamed protein product [Tilletia controversa]
MANYASWNEYVNCIESQEALNQLGASAAPNINATKTASGILIPNKDDSLQAPNPPSRQRRISKSPAQYKGFELDPAGPSAPTQKFARSASGPHADLGSDDSDDGLDDDENDHADKGNGKAKEMEFCGSSVNRDAG